MLKWGSLQMRMMMVMMMNEKFGIPEVMIILELLEL